MFYSKSTGGFYTREIHGDAMPSDCVEITIDQHASLLEGQSSGKVITADKDGAPVLTDPAPTPIPVLIEAAKTKVRALRSGVFSTLAGIQSESLAKGDTATALTIVTLQDMLKVLPETDLSACHSAADIDATFMAKWLAIVAIAPPSVASAFNQVMAP